MKTVVEHLSNLIRIPSVSTQSNRPVVEYAAKILCAAGWLTREMAYRDGAGVEKVNLIAAPTRELLENTVAALVFVCHTDTVPYAEDWTQALNPLIKEGLLYGRGSCDVKGFLACLLTAIQKCVPANLAGGLRLVLTADEEIGCVGASHLIAEATLRPRRMVIGEPTSLHPSRAGNGYCLADITVLGKEAHSAHPQEGTSAIYGAARLITAIQGLAANLATLKHSFLFPGFTTLNIGTIQGGSAKNIVPGMCRFQLEWRPIPGESVDAVSRAVSEIIRRQEEADLQFCAEFTVRRQQAGFETNENSVLVRSMEELTGRSAISIPFGSEASLFAPIADEVVVFGPGDMRTAHSSRECVPIAELEEAVACLCSMMQTP